MIITTALFTQIFGANKDAQAIVDALNEVLPTFGINTTDRIAAFLAQAGHESAKFTAKVENLNYSQSALLSVFGKYFNATTSAQYARQPQKIANRVYANRMGNGNEASGDGYKYRGRGYIQLTGKNNYTQCSADLNINGVDLVAHPEYLETIRGAVLSACWFWNKNNLNALADKHDIVGLTKRINGGTLGLADRQDLYARIKNAL